MVIKRCSLRGVHKNVFVNWCSQVVVHSIRLTERPQEGNRFVSDPCVSAQERLLISLLIDLYTRSLGRYTVYEWGLKYPGGKGFLVVFNCIGI